MFAPDITQSDVQAALRTFLLAVLPAGTEVIEGQDNRVPEPEGTQFVVMWPLRRERISTSVDRYVDAKFVGSIAGATMMVSSVDLGEVTVGNQVFGVGVAALTLIQSQLSGAPGGIGAYKVSVPQTVGPIVLSAGEGDVTAGTEITFQLDVHDADVFDSSGNVVHKDRSAEMAQTIFTLLRDDYGVRAIAAIDPRVTPLYTEDPRQAPFQNDQQQTEWRWIVEAHLQFDPTVATPQQFADSVDVGLIEVDTTYPP